MVRGVLPPKTFEFLRCPRCDQYESSPGSGYLRRRRSRNVGKWRVKHSKRFLLLTCVVCGQKVKFTICPTKSGFSGLLVNGWE